jgi:hypothetical protein
MPVALFTVRNLKILSGVAFCLAMLWAMSHALHKTINAGFAPAMFFDFVRQKFRMCSVLPPACASNGLV